MVQHGISTQVIAGVRLLQFLLSHSTSSCFSSTTNGSLHFSTGHAANIDLSHSVGVGWCSSTGIIEVADRVLVAGRTKHVCTGDLLADVGRVEESLAAARVLALERAERGGQR